MEQEKRKTARLVMNITGFGLVAIKSKSRLREVVLARWLYASIMYHYYGYNWTDIASTIGYSHCDIIYMVKNFNERKNDKMFPEYREVFSIAVKKMLNSETFSDTERIKNFING